MPKHQQREMSVLTPRQQLKARANELAQTYTRSESERLARNKGIEDLGKENNQPDSAILNETEA